MIKVVLALLGILASSQAQAAGEKQATLGLSSGASPNTVCIFDLSATRPCVQMGVLDSVAHIFTVKSPGFSVDPTGIASTSGLGITKTVNYGGGDNSLANSFIYAPNETVTGACVNLTGSGCIYHNMLVHDSADTSSNAVGTIDMEVEDDIFAAKGGRTVFTAKLLTRQTPGDTDTSNRNYGAGSFYVGSNFTAPATGTTNLFTQGNYNVVTAAGWNSQVGIEQDMVCGSPCNTPQMVGMQIVLLGANNVTPSQFFNGYLIGSAVNAISTVDVAYAIGGYAGYMPIKASGWIMRCVPHAASGTCRDFANNSTIAHGIDLSDLTFSNDAFKSIGFIVDGTGIVTGASYKAGATAGATCSGSPTASFASTGGIVTHC